MKFSSDEFLRLTQEFKLFPEQELRFEVEKAQWIKVEVIGSDGNAELFGTELIKNKPYYFHSGQGQSKYCQQIYKSD